MAKAAGDIEVRGPSAWWGGPLDVERLSVRSVAHVVHSARKVAMGRGNAYQGIVETPRVQSAFSVVERAAAFAGKSTFAPLSTFFQCRDGWVRLHANYRHHAKIIEETLGSCTPADVTEVVAAERAIDVEAAVVAGGGVAAAVRSVVEWATSGAGQALRSEPLLNIVVTGDRQALPQGGELPLQGIKVVDLTKAVAGPVATASLAALGAHVVRIDSPVFPEDPFLDKLLNREKDRVVLNFGVDSELDSLRELLSKCDVVVSSYRPGALARYGLDPESLRALNPTAIIASLSAWGLSGPWADRRGFDSIVQAACGLSELYGNRDGQNYTPGALPVQALNHAAGFHLAGAVMQGLAKRAEVGAVTIDTSLARVAWELHQLRREETGAVIDVTSSATDVEPQWRLPVATTTI